MDKQFIAKVNGIEIAAVTDESFNTLVQSNRLPRLSTQREEDNEEN